MGCHIARIYWCRFNAYSLDIFQVGSEPEEEKSICEDRMIMLSGVRVWNKVAKQHVMHKSLKQYIRPLGENHFFRLQVTYALHR